MVYKFRSLAGPDLTVNIKDSDGDGVAVNFTPINDTAGNRLGLFETEDPKIAEGMINDKRHGKLFYLGIKKKPEVKKSISKPAPKPTQSRMARAPKIQKTSKKKK